MTLGKKLDSLNNPSKNQLIFNLESNFFISGMRMNYISESNEITAQKMKFSIKIFPVNVTKSTGNCRFGHIYWRNP